MCRNLVVSAKNLRKKTDLSLIATYLKCSSRHPRLQKTPNHYFNTILIKVFWNTVYIYTKTALLTNLDKIQTQILPFAKIKHHSILHVYNRLTLRPSLIAKIGKRGLLDNSFWFYPRWCAKLVLDPGNIWWNEIITRKQGLLVQM